MRKFTVLLAAALIALLAIPAFADVPVAKAAYGTPVVDGVMDDVWQTAEEYKIDKLKDGEDGGVTAVWRALWDENAFYFYIEVNDTEHNFDGDVSWGDGAEIYFDPLDTDVNDYSTDDVVYFGFKADDVENTSFTGTDAGIEAFQNCYKLVSVVTETGFIYEASFALKTFNGGVNMKAGTVIGFDIQINNQSADASSRTGAYGWSDGDNTAWQDPSVFGKVIFEEPVIIETEPAAEPAAEAAPEAAAEPAPAAEAVPAAAAPSPQTFDIFALTIAAAALSGAVILKKKK
ncbi:MAG: sugar-binding protein [Eubacteriales bacterium]|jgi:endo-1,4-beta-xylanase